MIKTIKTIKTVKDSNNKEYRLREFKGDVAINPLKTWTIDKFDTRLNEAKVEVEGWYYVAFADSLSEAIDMLNTLTK